MGLRILCFQHPGTNSRDIFSDIIEGYRDAGHEVFVLELAPLWKQTAPGTSVDNQRKATELFVETVVSFARTNRIDLCITLWANAVLSMGIFENKSFFEHAGLPVLMHWLDAPQWAHQGQVTSWPTWRVNGPLSAHVINNSATAAEVQGVMGFSNVLSVPNAASPRMFRPYDTGPQEFDIVFGVGADNSEPTDLMLAELKKDDPDIVAIRKSEGERLRPALEKLLLDSVAQPTKSGPEVVASLVGRMIDARMQSRNEPVLGQFAQVSKAHPELANLVLGLLQNPKHYVAFSMLLRDMESWERAFTFVYLSRYFKCATFGLTEPFKSWPGEWGYLGSLKYEDQAKAYSRSRFGLNVMRWQDDIGLNLKPFEITLSGACLLQSYRVGIEEMFDDSQIVVFDTPKACRENVERLLHAPDELKRRAAAGRARSLSTHCWKHRAEAIIGTLGLPNARGATSAPQHRAPDVDSLDHRVVFVLGQWRSGTTLLRKVLDSHSQIYAPAETWFLLPLLNIWQGDGTPENRQTAAAVRGHLNHEQFLACCRAFAESFYKTSMPSQARFVVDKTPFYIRLADDLPRMMPGAKFIVLTRDPRSTVWSRHTWKHIQSETPEGHFASVASDNRVLDQFLTKHPERSVHVRYEDLCTRPEEVASVLCHFLQLPAEPDMVEYGCRPHHEGYGDETTRAHHRPHENAIARWSGDTGLSQDQQIQLAIESDPAVLRRLGYPELAELGEDHGGTSKIESRESEVGCP
ncbi:MAG: sulfotransferase [Phycisphaerales bacterium]|nr:sulfotransferase [Phycisphaerales bacterium]